MVGLGSRHNSKTLAEVKRGVTVRFLSGVFDMPEATVRKKLKTLRPIGNGRGTSIVYSFSEAAAHLVTPNMPIEEWIKTLKRDDLPDQLRETWWNSRLKEQRWSIKSKKLWHDDDVIAAFADILSIVRTSLQLVPATLEQGEGLSVEQREMLVTLIDGVQDNIYQKVVKYSARSDVGPQFDDIEIIGDGKSSRRKDMADLI